ncbi:MAG: hypothetical protein GY714_23480 [Desulfobacterales bacterium]|nr:hypothetical protein [Desulfobacterales bacterium]
MMDKSDFKYNIVALLIQDDLIAQLILNTDKDYTSVTYSDLQKKRMENQNIFKYMLNPNIKTDTTSLIMMSANFIYQPRGLDTINLLIELYTNVNNQITSHGKERNDALSERVKQLILSSKNLGMGEMVLKSETDLKPVDDYVVAQLLFRNLTHS